MKIIKPTLLVLLLLINVNLYAQTKEDTIVSWFKYISKVDQTYLKKSKVFIRDQIFVNNFRIINDLIDEGVLKKELLNSFSEKSVFKIDVGFHITFIHVLQTAPNLILNKDYIEFIENEIVNNNFKKEFLVYPLSIYHFNMTYYQNDSLKKVENGKARLIDHQYDALFYEALEKWGIEVSELKKKLGK